MIEVLQSKLIPLLKKPLIVALFVLIAIGVYKVIHRSHPVDNIPISLVKPIEYKDKNGVIHDQFKVRELTQEEMDHITDSIRRTIKDHPQIKEVVTYVPHIDTEWRDLPVVIKGDTVETSKIDSYVTAKAIINTKTNKGFISLELRDTITEVRTFKNHLFRANMQTIDITNRNPYVKVVAGSAILVKEPKPILILGPSIVYNPFTQKLNYGIGLTLNVLSIKNKR